MRLWLCDFHMSFLDCGSKVDILFTYLLAVHISSSGNFLSISFAHFSLLSLSLFFLFKLQEFFERVIQSFSHSSICLLIMFLESSFIHIVRSPVLVIGQVSENTDYSFNKYLLSARTLWDIL